MLGHFPMTIFIMSILLWGHICRICCLPLYSVGLTCTIQTCGTDQWQCFMLWCMFVSYCMICLCCVTVFRCSCRQPADCLLVPHNTMGAGSVWAIIPTHDGHVASVKQHIHAKRPMHHYCGLCHINFMNIVTNHSKLHIGEKWLKVYCM